MPTRTAPRTQMMRKALRTPASASPVRNVKVKPEGIVRAIVAVTGVVDAVNDLIVPGAFTASLARRRPKVVDDHEWGRKAGRVVHVEEWLPGDARLPETTKDGKPWPAAAGALVAVMQYNLYSAAGRESYEWVRFYAESNEAEFSIGYKVPDGKARLRRDGVRVILEVDLFEFSHVLFGAAPLSMALEVKSLHGATAGGVAKPALGEAERTDDEDDDRPLPEVPDKPWDEDEVEVKTAAAVVLEAKGLADSPVTAAAPMEVKGFAQMKGSFQERECLLRQAAQDLLDAQGDVACTWVDLVATYDAETVVQAYYKDDTQRAYLVPYTYDAETGTVELGAPDPVTLSLVAEPANGAPVPPEAAEVDVDEAVIAAPMLDQLQGASILAGVQGKVGDLVRARIAELAAGLAGKAAPAPSDEPADPAANEAPATQEPTEESAAEPSGDDVITASTLPEGGWDVYRKTEPIEARRMEGPFKVQTREGEVECEDGWLAIDSDGFPYPIAAEEFDAVYAPATTPATTPAEPDLSGELPADAETAPPADEATPDDVEHKDEPAEESTEEAPSDTVTIDPDEHFATLDSLDAALEDEDDDEG